MQTGLWEAACKTELGTVPPVAHLRSDAISQCQSLSLQGRALERSVNADGFRPTVFNGSRPDGDGDHGGHDRFKPCHATLHSHHLTHAGVCVALPGAYTEAEDQQLRTLVSRYIGIKAAVHGGIASSAAGAEAEERAADDDDDDRERAVELSDAAAVRRAQMRKADGMAGAASLDEAQGVKVREAGCVWGQHSLFLLVVLSRGSGRRWKGSCGRVSEAVGSGRQGGGGHCACVCLCVLARPVCFPGGAPTAAILCVAPRRAHSGGGPCFRGVKIRETGSLERTGSGHDGCGGPDG